MISDATIHGYEATRMVVEFNPSIDGSQRLTLRFHRPGEMHDMHLLLSLSQLAQIGTEIDRYLQDLGQIALDDAEANV